MVLSTPEANILVKSALGLLKISVGYDLSKAVIDILTKILSRNGIKMNGGNIMKLQKTIQELEKQLEKARSHLKEGIRKQIRARKAFLKRLRGGAIHKYKKKGGAIHSKENKAIEKAALGLLKIALGYEISTTVLSQIQKLLSKQ